MAEADRAAGVHDADAARAVGQLRDLGEVNAEIARLCGISVTAVRKLAATARAGAGAAVPGSDAGSGSGAGGTASGS